MLFLFSTCTVLESHLHSKKDADVYSMFRLIFVFAIVLACCNRVFFLNDTNESL